MFLANKHNLISNARKGISMKQQKSRCNTFIGLPLKTPQLLWLVLQIAIVSIANAQVNVSPVSIDEVNPPIGMPGETITITGDGFQDGARGLIWGGTAYLENGVDTPDFALGVSIENGYAFVADEQSGLQVVDISNPSTPMIVASVDTPSTANAVAVANGYAYIADGIALQVIDVSEPMAPVIVGSVDTPGNAVAVAVVNGFAFVADSDKGLQVIDISNPSNPAIVGSLGSIRDVVSVAVTNGYVYTSTWDDVVGDYVFLVVDVSNPNAPTILSSLVSGCHMRGVSLENGYAYAACGNYGLQVIDINISTNPVIVGEVRGAFQANAVTVENGHAYIAGNSTGLTIIDINSPFTLLVTATVDTPGAARGVALANGRAYIADGGNGLQIIDIQNQSPAVNIGGLDINTDYYLISVENSYAYVIGAHETNPGSLFFSVVDLSSPTAPKILGSLDLLTSGSVSLSIVGNLAYIIFDDKLRVIDVSNPMAPTIVGSVDMSRRSYAISVVSDYAYIVDGDGLQVFDITNPMVPVVVGGVNTPGFAKKIAIANEYAYILEHNSLKVLNIGNPAAPIIVGSLDILGFSSGLLVENGYAYIPSSNNGGELQVIDISNPTIPTFSSSVDLSNLPYINISSVSNEYIYLTSYLGGLAIIDISNPHAPAYVGNASVKGYAHDVNIEGGYAYVATEKAGLQNVLTPIPSPSTWLDSGTLTLDIPAHLPPGIYDVTVANPDGTVYKARNALTISGTPVGPEIDTDGDGMPDSYEMLYGLDPNDPADAALDLDNDGLSNLAEYNEGTYPNNPDTDGDGANDGREVAAGTDPLDDSSTPALDVSYFEFSIISDVQTNEFFNVRITAKLGNEDIDTDFTNRCVDLSVNYSNLTVAPNKICFQNGIGNEAVSIFGAGANDAKLEAEESSLFDLILDPIFDNQGMVGSSNAFVVEDPMIVPTTLEVDVVYDSSVGQLFYGTVYLETSDGVILQQDTPVKKMFYFEGLNPGIYKLWAVGKSGFWRSPPLNKVVINASHEQTPRSQSAQVKLLEVGRPPVLVLPGIMGSTNKGWGELDNATVPYLPKELAAFGELKILNGIPGAADGGFDGLKVTLTNAGFNVITVPWDWRATLDMDKEKTKNAITRFLIPALDNAKNPDGDLNIDFPKVDVVAHSMGGLLVRSYIQSDGYRNDIRRFVMVGTPNKGSAKTYPMIQGGQPKRADDLEGDCTEKKALLIPLGNLPCFYSRSTDFLYQAMNDGKSPFAKDEDENPDFSIVNSRENLVLFYNNEVPTGLQLLPTDNVLKFVGESTLEPLTHQPNEFLTKLNNHENIARFSKADVACNNTEKVATKIFYSTSENTLELLLVERPSQVQSTIVYGDGKLISTVLPPVKTGDGTVTSLSAIGRLNIDSLGSDVGVHSELMGKFKSQISDFLVEDCPQ